MAEPALPAVGAAVATGISIAGYTVIDATAVGFTPVAVYAAWMFLLQGPVLPLIAVVRRGRDVVGQVRPVLIAGFGGGLVSIAAYGLVLVGTLFLGERFGRSRVVAAVVVAVGIALVSL